jgi:hypothetical protein
MLIKESHKVIKALAEGVDPLTYAAFPQDSVLQNPIYVRAFFVALKALELQAAQEERRSRLPINTGKPWSQVEDEKLLEEFDKGASIKLLAGEFGRSLTSIRARLTGLGRELPELGY